MEKEAASSVMIGRPSKEILPTGRSSSGPLLEELEKSFPAQPIRLALIPFAGGQPSCKESGLPASTCLFTVFL